MQVQVLFPAPNQYNPNQLFLVGDGFGLFLYLESDEPASKPRRWPGRPSKPRKRKEGHRTCIRPGAPPSIFRPPRWASHCSAQPIWPADAATGKIPAAILTFKEFPLPWDVCRNHRMNLCTDVAFTTRLHPRHLRSLLSNDILKAR